MLRLWLSLGAGVAVLVGTALVASMANAQPQPGADPTAVITAYEMARNHRDVDTALSYFADSAIVTQRNTTFTGRDEIRKFLDNAAVRSRFVVISDRHVSGNHVTWVERLAATGPQTSSPQPPQGRSPGLAGTALVGSAFAINVEAVIQDGKIQSLAYTFGGQAPQPDPALDGRAQMPAPVGLGVVLTLLIGLLAIVSVGIGRASPVSSSLRGRLMHDLRGWASARQ